MVSSWAAVLRKDLLAIAMFLLVTVAIVLFSLPGEQIAPSMISALFWIALFLAP